jgi:lipid-A-disaccharide synthase
MPVSGADRPLKIAIVAGEESGDLLGADLVDGLAGVSGRHVELIGVGGRHLQERGLATMFEPGDIALMGISAVLRDLPRLMRRIGATARAIAAAKPDCLVTIDSPDFNLRVAAKLRAIAPSIPIVHYVCPSVWAWRPGRAPAMKPHVDRILCVLPFEAAELARLDGPPGTYVGHRLVSDPGVAKAFDMQSAKIAAPRDAAKTLLLLPGSRRGEVKRLIEPFGEAVAALKRRGHELRLVLPTVPHVADLVRQSTAGWADKPEIIVDRDAKWQAFGEADAALTASGTVLLELALAGVPTISCYRLDPIARLAERYITVWSAALPNLIADEVVVPEFYDRFVRPEYLARYLESLFTDTEQRRWQRTGFAEIRRRMATARPSGILAAEAVIETTANRK